MQLLPSIARRLTRQTSARPIASWLAGWILAACVTLPWAAIEGLAQQPLDPVLTANQQQTAKKKPARYKQAPPEMPEPNLQIPVAPLGFAAPAVFYLTERFSQASLNFLSENTLLFTFRVPGLISRTSPAPGESRADTRQIRAVVLDLPSGRIAAEALWEVHDYGPYLWTLNDGKFLLRDRNMVQMGDATLKLEPFLRFPGDVTYLELDPENRYLIADTLEVPAAAKTESLPATAPASIVSSGNKDAQNGQDGGSAGGDSRPAKQTLLRIMSMDQRSVLLYARINGVAHLPIDGEGYYEALRGNGPFWIINYQDFHGASQPIGTVRSSCNPALEVLAPRTVLASSCGVSGGRTLSLVQRNGESKPIPRAADDLLMDMPEKPIRNLWDVPMPDTRVWPQVVKAPQGRRFARSTLDVTHAVGPSAPLDREDIRSQTVDVFDVATGKVALSVEASPVLDAGGNFALSPSGARFAVISQGAIQVFDLPAAPAMPAAPAVVSSSARPDAAQKKP